MLVEDLKKALRDLPDDMEVIVASDDEGNDFDTPYFPSVAWCAEDDETRCGWRPVADEDVDTEYDKEDLVQMVVM